MIIKNKYYQIIVSVFTLIIASISLIISIRSCKISQESTEISRKSYELNLEPVLGIEFGINISERKYSFKISNNGPITVYDIEIFKEINIYAEKGITLQGIKNINKPWKLKDELKIGDTILYHIDFKDLEELYLGFTNKQLILKDDNSIRTVLFKISFIKKPEFKQYRMRKYLFVEPINYFGDTTIYGFDPENHFTSIYGNKLKIVETIEAKRVWNEQDFLQ